MDLTLVTLNCAKLQQTADTISNLVSTTLPMAPPMLVAFAFQEVAPLLEASWRSVDSYTSTIMKGITSGFQSKYTTVKYKLIGESFVGGVGIIVFGQEDTLQVEGVKQAWVGFGLLRSTLKAAVALRVYLCSGTKLTFVSTHLAANSGNVSYRNANYNALAHELDFDGEPLYTDESNHHIFVLGDLNYRVSDQNQNDDSNDSLLGNDELILEMAKGNTLYGLSEAQISFKPTFKFFIGSNTYDKSRKPSWCDRILYLDPTAKCHVYQSVPSFTNSDHKPVYLQLTIHNQFRTPPVTVPAPQQYNFGNLYSWWIDAVMATALFLITTSQGRMSVGGALLLGFFFLMW